MNLTTALYDALAGDATLTALLSAYEGSPAIFTTDPPPGDATLPYIVSAGHVVDLPFDTKTKRGRDVQRDIRCYDDADGSAVTVEAMAERVLEILHRQPLSVNGFQWILSDCSGPLAADESDAYGRIITLRYVAQEDSGS